MQHGQTGQATPYKYLLHLLLRAARFSQNIPRERSLKLNSLRWQETRHLTSRCIVVPLASLALSLNLPYKPPSTYEKICSL